MVIFGDGFDKQDSAGPRGRFVLSGYARREIFQNWMQTSLYVQRAEDLYQHWLPPPDFFSSLLPGAIQTLEVAGWLFRGFERVKVRMILDSRSLPRRRLKTADNVTSARFTWGISGWRRHQTSDPPGVSWAFNPRLKMTSVPSYL